MAKVAGQEIIEQGGILVTDNPGSVLTIPNLGTSVAVIAYDRNLQIGGIAHIILPDNTTGKVSLEDSPPAKYASEGIPAFLDQLQEAGASKLGTSIRMSGGAQLFNFGGGGGNALNVGARNAIAIRAALSKHGFALDKADIGGNKGRKLMFYMDSGVVEIEQIGGNTYIL